MALSKRSVKYWLVAGSAMVLLAAVSLAVRGLAPTTDDTKESAGTVAVNPEIVEITAAEARAMLGTDGARNAALDPGLEAAGLLVFLDEAGNRVPGNIRDIPGAELAPMPRGPIYTWVGESPAGGIGMDATHIRAYAFATIDRDGVVEVDCVTGTIEAVNEAIANAQRREE